MTEIGGTDMACTLLYTIVHIYNTIEHRSQLTRPEQTVSIHLLRLLLCGR